MTVRTTRNNVTFHKSFKLDDFEEIFPSGSYEVEIDEVVLGGLSFNAYRRTVTLIHLPAREEQRELKRILTIDPRELDPAIFEKILLL